MYLSIHSRNNINKLFLIIISGPNGGTVWKILHSKLRTVRVFHHSSTHMQPTQLLMLTWLRTATHPLCALAGRTPCQHKGTDGLTLDRATRLGARRTQHLFVGELGLHLGQTECLCMWALNGMHLHSGPALNVRTRPALGQTTCKYAQAPNCGPELSAPAWSTMGRTDGLCIRAQIGP